MNNYIHMCINMQLYLNKRNKKEKEKIKTNQPFPNRRTRPSSRPRPSSPGPPSSPLARPAPPLLGRSRPSSAREPSRPSKLRALPPAHSPAHAAPTPLGLARVRPAAARQPTRLVRQQPVDCLASCVAGARPPVAQAPGRMTPHARCASLSPRKPPHMPTIPHAAEPLDNCV
jgi:hypothetical protein